MKLLLTAFDPFGKDTVNPALEAMHAVRSEHLQAELIRMEVPTVFGTAARLVNEAILYHKPDAVVALGQAGGRSAVTVERVAINISDANLADNAGDRPTDVPVRDGGPAAYFSTLPIKAIVTAIREAGIPAEVSNSAGTFVCNHLMYSILDGLANQKHGAIGGFIHVPYMPAQTVGRSHLASMSLVDITRSIEIALAVVSSHLQRRT